MVAQQPLAVVLGANRGIGLELTRELQLRGCTVIACCRTVSPELSHIPSVTTVEGVDITAEDSYKHVLQALDGRKIGILLVVAGHQQLDSLADVDAPGLRKHFEVNAIAPLLAVQALRGSLGMSSKVVFLASKMGSCGDGRTGGGLYGYRMSKAALNCAGATLARDLKEDGIAVSLIHPGAVDTDMCRSCRRAMGRPEAELSKGLLSADDSARRVLGLVDKMDMDNSGTYWAADTGEILSW